MAVILTFFPTKIVHRYLLSEKKSINTIIAICIFHKIWPEYKYYITKIQFIS